MDFRRDINSDLAAQALGDEARIATEMALDSFDLDAMAAALDAVEMATEDLRRCTVRAVVAQGASWEQVAAALGVTVAQARESYATITTPRDGPAAH